MSVHLFDPSTPRQREPIDYAPRPAELRGLRVGLVENTKFNSDKLLLKVAERLQARHGAETVWMNRKRASSAHVDEEALARFKRSADVVIAGVGD